MSAWREWQEGLISEEEYKNDYDLDDWRAQLVSGSEEENEEEEDK